MRMHVGSCASVRVRAHVCVCLRVRVRACVCVCVCARVRAVSMLYSARHMGQSLCVVFMDPDLGLCSAILEALEASPYISDALLFTIPSSAVPEEVWRSCCVLLLCCA